MVIRILCEVLMSKVNYKKVEDVLSEGMIKITAKRLLELSSIAARINEEVKEEIANQNESEVKAEGYFPSAPDVSLEKERELFLKRLLSDLKMLQEKDPQLLNKLHITIAEINNLVRHSRRLSEQDWKVMQRIQESVAAHVNVLRNQAPKNKKKKEDKLPISDETLVESERIRHINKRFKVKDGWLPLR